MNITEYYGLLKSYEKCSIRICIEKCCDYKFIILLNGNARLKDIYNYVIQFYSHVTEPLLLYLDKEHTKMIPNNEIYISKYLERNKITSITSMELPVVYKFYLDICSKHKNIYNQHYNEIM